MYCHKLETVSRKRLKKGRVVAKTEACYAVLRHKGDCTGAG